jgi:hypothetical protein
MSDFTPPDSFEADAEEVRTVLLADMRRHFMLRSLCLVAVLVVGACLLRVGADVAGTVGIILFVAGALVAAAGGSVLIESCFDHADDKDMARHMGWDRIWRLAALSLAPDGWGAVGTPSDGALSLLDPEHNVRALYSVTIDDSLAHFLLIQTVDAHG